MPPSNWFILAKCLVKHYKHTGTDTLVPIVLEQYVGGGMIVEKLGLLVNLYNNNFGANCPLNSNQPLFH